MRLSCRGNPFDRQTAVSGYIAFERARPFTNYQRHIDELHRCAQANDVLLHRQSRLSQAKLLADATLDCVAQYRRARIFFADHEAELRAQQRFTSASFEPPIDPQIFAALRTRFQCAKKIVRLQEPGFARKLGARYHGIGSRENCMT
jgi:hypothetical protein